LIAVVIRNNDANSKVLLNGAPCFFIADATLRGLDVNTAEGLASANQAFFAGFNLNPSRNIGDSAKQWRLDITITPEFYWPLVRLARMFGLVMQQ